MDKLKDGIKTLSPFDDEKIDYMISQFSSYMEGVLEWNEKVNLTAIKDRDDFIIKHFLDSIMCLPYPEFMDSKNIIDVGTGAGFPGVPLAIVSPDKNFTLLDSLKKRLNIVDELCSEAGIKNTFTIHGRAEELAKNKQFREQFDLCVSRAVANMSVLCEYCLPFIKVGGYLLAYKGPEALSEAEEAKKAISILGGSLEEIRETKMEKYGINHNVLIIKKIKETPSKYPRKAGTPSKEPLK